MTPRTEPLAGVEQGYRLAAEQFRSALASGYEVVERAFTIAGRTVGVRAVGSDLASEFIRSWSHLASTPLADREGDGPGELAVDIWHRSETRVEIPETEIDPLDRFPYRTSRDDRFLAMQQPETSAWLDRRTANLVAGVGRVDECAHYELGRPLETPLLVWLRDRGVPLVHASFVAHADRGALILGQSGSGKSTLAAQSLCEGFDFLSDDKIAVTGTAEKGFVGHSLSSSLHLDAGSLHRVPLLEEHAVAPSLPLDDKHRITVGELFPDRMSASAPIRALIIPRLRKGTDPTWAPATKRDALLALALSTLMALPISGQRSLEDLAELAETVPAFSFDLDPHGHGPTRLATLLDQLPDLQGTGT